MVEKNNRMDFDKHRIIKAVSTKLTALEDTRSGRSLWSGLVKKVFIELASVHGFKVATAGATARAEGAREHTWGEWLYDLVWYTSKVDQDTGMERTTSVPLVMECEWDASLASIALDFDKLLVANADLRVLVCGEYSGFPREAVFSYCQRAVEGFARTRPGDTFLVCVIPEVGKVECKEIQA